MSRYTHHYRIHYDGNCGETETKEIFIRYNASSDCQKVVDEDGNTIVCDGTDSYVEVLGNLLAGKPMDDKYYGWETVQYDVPIRELPEKVRKAFGIKLSGEKGGVDLGKLSDMLDEALSRETKESLLEKYADYDLRKEGLFKNAYFAKSL